MMDRKDVKYILILAILSYFFFFFGNGLISLTNPDEVFYAQTAKEMAHQRVWMTPVLFDKPQFEKPILTYWLLRIAYLAFGLSSFSARFFPACFAFLGIIAVYYFSKLLFREYKRSFITSLVLLSSALYIGLARTVFTDMIFSVLILFSLLCFYWGYLIEGRKKAGILLFFVFSAFAVLTKGPLGIIIPLSVVVVFLCFSRNIRFIFCKDAFWGMIVFLAVALPWYIFMINRYSQSFIHEFFYNDHFRRLIEAEHTGNDTWYFYPLAMLGCMLPWSIFLGVGVFYTFFHARKSSQGDIFILCWIITTFLIFQFAHSKLTSYIFPMFPALAMVAGNFIYDSIQGKERQKQFFIISAIMCVAVLFMLIGLIVAGSRFSIYLPSLRPVYFMLCVLGLWLLMTISFIMKKRAYAVFNSLVVLIPVLISGIPFVHKEIESYFSSSYACEYLLNNYKIGPGAYLLCSRNYVRGARFYTDMNTAVYNSSNFFSPHPIPFLNFDNEVKEFLRKQGITYGFLKKSSVADLKRVIGREFDLRILKVIGDEYIVRIKQK